MKPVFQRLRVTLRGGTSEDRSALRLPGVDLVDADAEVVVVAGGPDGLREARAETELPIIALVERLDRSSANALLDAGADGIVTSDFAPERMSAALRAAGEGLLVFPPEARQAVQPPVLTARQKQILGLVVIGLSNRDIAQRLFVAEATVKSHLTGIFAKLGVSSRKEAAHLVLHPHSGLGPGVLSISGDEQVQQGYGAPTLGS